MDGDSSAQQIEQVRSELAALVKTRTVADVARLAGVSERNLANFLNRSVEVPREPTLSALLAWGKKSRESHAPVRSPMARDVLPMAAAVLESDPVMAIVREGQRDQLQWVGQFANRLLGAYTAHIQELVTAATLQELDAAADAPLETTTPSAPLDVARSTKGTRKGRR